MKTSFRGKMKPACLGLTVASALLAFASVSQADDNRYQQTNLVSDLPGVALLQDTNLVNAWGISFGPSTPFWVSDNGTGVSTLYSVTNDTTGAPHVNRVPLVVHIPGDGTPTGQAFSSAGGFNGDIFLFVSEDGTVSGWRSTLGTAAETLVPGNTNTVYKGMTLASTPNNGLVLLASNFRQGTVDMYGTNSALLGQFSDSNAPAGYAPFGIQTINGTVFVTFAKQDAAKHDDVAGAGNGLIDVFNPETGAFQRFATGRDAVIRGKHGTRGPVVQQMNSPWGIALAPESFGQAGGLLLVGNFGSGTIMSFDSNGRFRGELRAANGKLLSIDGLWGLTFGNGTQSGVTNTLYFSAGPSGESHGLFGSVQPFVKSRGHH
ncbi:MAG TPA: TIGR03118 family protein [Verrucomicrobiae bacterium]|nr:TIGR03118 family protein [Verrucomicrobiae bacterium]